MTDVKKIVPIRFHVLLGFIALIASLFGAAIFVGTRGYTNWGMTPFAWIELFCLLALVALIITSVRRDWTKILRATKEHEDGFVRKGD